MNCLKILFCLLVVYNVNGQDCSFLANLPQPLRNLLQGNVPNTIPVTNLGISAPSCGCISSGINIKQCGCPEPNCGCYGLIQAPIVPPGYSAALGLPNPIIGLQGCGCTNSYGACNCGTPAVGNLCGRSTPQIGLATSCGCQDPTVRIIDGCPNCQPIYSYNLPSLGVPTCGCIGVPSYLPSIGLPNGLGACGCNSFAPVPCGCSGPCGCNSLAPVSCGCSGPCGCNSLAPVSCGCSGPCGCTGSRGCCKRCGLPLGTCNCKGPCGCPLATCTCKGPCGCPVNSCSCNSQCGCPNINSCGCIEVPCGLPQVKTTCTCVTPTIDTPCGCTQGQPTCACTTTLEVPTCEIQVLPPFSPVIGCTRYLRQVCVQPPFL